MRKLYKETNIEIFPKWSNFDYINCIPLQIATIDNTIIIEYIREPYTTLTPIETLHTNHQPKKMTKAELSRYLYDNYYDANDNAIDLTDLDFRQFNCNVNISSMKVHGSLSQCNQFVKFNLDQDLQEVGGNLAQDNQNVKGEIYQDKVGDEV